ncbi:MAG: hypothetical protein SYNGOMJ08_00417 [Candidatus Syntrophoarchaeum sp. GoM_oil]|nr:MAG: hypothetical protein SYNGOMJ08_00417 [Candidatus Syntrophoarchaeum sp. GoM_oil]
MSDNINNRVLELVRLHRSVIEKGGGLLCRRFNEEASKLLIDLEEEGLFNLSDRLMDVLSRCTGASHEEQEGICEKGRMVQKMLEGIEKKVKEQK